MQRRLIITDLTQMQGDRVCVAAVDHSWQNMRPHIGGGVYERHLYNADQAVIFPRAVVELNLSSMADEIIPPHIEDRRWHVPPQTIFKYVADDDRWRHVLEETQHDSVQAIFGTKLDRNKNLPVGQAKQSIGTVRISEIHWFEHEVKIYDGREKHGYRLSFTDMQGERYEHVQVTDLALRYNVHLHLARKKTSEQAGWEIAKSLKTAGEVWLRVGLGREWNQRHWLQVNAIHTFPDYLSGRNFDHFKREGITLP